VFHIRPENRVGSGLRSLPIGHKRNAQKNLGKSFILSFFLLIRSPSLPAICFVRFQRSSHYCCDPYCGSPHGILPSRRPPFSFVLPLSSCVFVRSPPDPTLLLSSFLLRTSPDLLQPLVRSLVLTVNWSFCLFGLILLKCSG
jgi:hypothetical protein